MELKVIALNEDRTSDLYASSDSQELIKSMDGFYAKIGFNRPWVGYFAIQDGAVLGTGGFTGKPQNGKVEIAYWTFKEFEGKGVASFVCKELIRIAQKTDPALIITAKTAPEQNASTKILKNNGFEFTEIVQDAEIGDAWLWTLNPLFRDMHGSIHAR